MTCSRERIKPEDWTTIWQSEMTALAVDREIAEGLSAIVSAWNLSIVPGNSSMEQPDAARFARTNAPPGTTASAAPLGNVGRVPDVH